MSSSVEKALQMVIALSQQRMTATELAEQLDVHRSTASRLVSTLEEYDFVRRSPDGTLRLGTFLAALSRSAVTRTDVAETARPHLQQLGELHGHTIHLAGVEETRIRYWDKIESRQTIRMYSTIGAVAPAHATGVGKAILAHLTESERGRLVRADALNMHTENTHQSYASLAADLDGVVERGWAIDDAEHEDFIHCVAAPIFDGQHGVVAAVSISAPQVIVGRDQLLNMADDLRNTAHDISHEMGDPTR